MSTKGGSKRGFKPGDLVAFAGGDGYVASDGGVQYPVDGEALTVLRVERQEHFGRARTVVTCRNGHGHEIDTDAGSLRLSAEAAEVMKKVVEAGGKGREVYIGVQVGDGPVKRVCGPVIYREVARERRVRERRS